MGENGKDPVNYAPNVNSLLGAPREEHSIQRRILSHAFSAQAMVEQQPIICEYIDKLFVGLQRNSQNGTQLVEMTSWLNWFTFDVIGDLAFGESFGCLDNLRYHSWVSLTFGVLKFVRLRTEIQRFGPLAALVQDLLIRTLTKSYKDNLDLATARVRKSIDAGTNRPDFINKMMEGGKKKDYVSSRTTFLLNTPSH